MKQNTDISIFSSDDTIAALATPPGRGGVAIIRISGPNVKAIMFELLRENLAPRKASYLPFLDAHGESLDEGVAILFPKPHSFTGEDVLELQGHGAPIVVDLLLQRINELGARLARPGEFSERAFLNAKMDLTQAEAIADLIQAQSREATLSAMRSLQGSFSKEITRLLEELIQLRMYVEAAIDFTDEDINFLSDQKLLQRLNTLLEMLQTIQKKAKQGIFLRDGITAVITGVPNVGKSSLLNYLCDQEIAIVSDQPGTTRDVLRQSILIDGMPIEIIDTAGLRESRDAIEQEGIRRAHEVIKHANLLLALFDANANDLTLACQGEFPGPVIYIRNKIDLLNEPPAVEMKNEQIIVSLSAKTGEGVELLRKQIKLAVGFESESEGIYLARKRHIDALLKANEHVLASLHELSNECRGELAAEELRLAQLALSEITGKFTTEDLLGRIFSSFCIGK